MTEEEKQEVAAFRFSVIHDFLGPNKLEYGQQEKLLAEKCGSLVAIDAMELARDAGSPMSVNIVLLGALVQSGSLGFTKENVIEAIKRRTKKAFLDMNLKAFELGYEAAQNYRS
jgi:indolepyruvate ferredoxin oxidoreductase beta subunit